MDIKDDAPANHVNYNSEGAGLYKYGSFASCLDSNHSKGCTAEQIALGELQNPNCRAAQSALQSFHDDVNRLTGKALAWSLFFGAIGGGAEEWRKKPGGFAPKFNITSALLAMDVQLFMMLQEKNKLEDEHLLACGWVYR